MVLCHHCLAIHLQFCILNHKYPVSGIYGNLSCLISARGSRRLGACVGHTCRIHGDDRRRGNQGLSPRSWANSLPLSARASDGGRGSAHKVGIGAKSVAASQLIQSPPALVVNSVQWKKDVLLCQPALSSTALQIPLAQIRIICAGNIVPAKQKSEREALAEMALASGSSENVSNVTTGWQSERWYWEG